MKVAVVGSRDYPEPDAVQGYVEEAYDTWRNRLIIVSGGARGVDTWAAEEARRLMVPVYVIPADWDKHGRSAGFRRNHDIVAEADKVVAFWDGKSKGTKHTIDLALKEGVDLEVIFPESPA